MLLALSLLPTVSLIGCSRSESLPPGESGRPAYFIEVRQTDADTLAWVGEVRASQRAELAFPVSGRIATVAADIGDIVFAGQILATLDLLPLKAQLEVAQADLTKAHVQVAESRARFDRVRRAQIAGAASDAEVTAAQSELAHAEAALTAAQSQRDTAAWNLQNGTMRAPFDGVIASRHIERGQLASSATAAFSVDGTGRELLVLLPADVALRPGKAVTISSSGSEVSSRVLRMASRLDPGGVRRVFFTAPDNADVGSTWSINLATSTRPFALRVPLRAVVPSADSGTGTVLRIAKDGKTVESVSVKMGVQHGDMVEIAEGLSDGDRVVISGASSIRPGTLVRPIPYRTEAKS